MAFSVNLKLSWGDSGRLTCALSDWTGPLDECLLSIAEELAVSIEALDVQHAPTEACVGRVRLSEISLS